MTSHLSHAALACSSSSVSAALPLSPVVLPLRLHAALSSFSSSSSSSATMLSSCRSSASPARVAFSQSSGVGRKSFSSHKHACCAMPLCPSITHVRCTERRTARGCRHEASSTSLALPSSLSLVSSCAIRRRLASEFASLPPSFSRSLQPPPSRPEPEEDRASVRASMVLPSLKRIGRGSTTVVRTPCRITSSQHTLPHPPATSNTSP
eukprot:2758508-Rhodomonas_salina.1